MAAKKRGMMMTGMFHGKSNMPGGGGRFAQIEAKAAAAGARSPAAVAAAAGRKSRGQAYMTKVSVAGRKRAARKKKKAGM